VIDIQLRSGAAIVAVVDDGTDTAIEISGGDRIVLHGFSASSVPVSPSSGSFSGTDLSQINDWSEEVFGYQAIFIT
jgi:hypothetical protein